ncbi:hypothetical protein CDL15_Pgr023666 [Punica granatum]|nr:hypothetical protein CDL15_Pgr023666 [Punica granatum]
MPQPTLSVPEGPPLDLRLPLVGYSGWASRRLGGDASANLECSLGVHTRISSRRGTHAHAYATRLGSVHLPGDAREKESPLTVYDPKVEGR